MLACIEHLIPLVLMSKQYIVIVLAKNIFKKFEFLLLYILHILVICEIYIHWQCQCQSGTFLLPFNLPNDMNWGIECEYGSKKYNMTWNE